MNYAPLSRIETAPSPGTAGVTATLQENTGDRFPVVPFTGLMCPAQTIPILGENAEQVNVTSITGDDIIFTRSADPVDIEEGWMFYALREEPSYDLGEAITLAEEFSASNPPYSFFWRAPDGTAGSAVATDAGSGDATYTFTPTVPGHWVGRFAGGSETGSDQGFYIRFSDAL